MSGLVTLAGTVRLQQEVRKSRFLAQASPVADAETALAFLDHARADDASHHCWAWRIGAAYRYNDDGEPGGSAGRPILLAIDSQGVDRVMVVVTRWFGGIKLGVGGLARAYGGCAAECLRLAPKVALVRTTRLRVHCDFAAAAHLHARLRDFAAVRRTEVAFAAGVALDLELPAAQVDAFSRFVRDLTRGRGVVEAVP